MKFGIGQVDARTSTYEHSDHLQSLKFAPLPHKGEDSLALHGIPSGCMRIEATQLLKNGIPRLIVVKFTKGQNTL